MIKINKIYNIDCLEGMKLIENESIDLILCDLPYKITDFDWDKIISLDLLWLQYERIIKNDGAIVLIANQPFTSELILSNKKLFKYCWIWKKNRVTGFMNSHYQPLKNYEDIIIFAKGNCMSNSSTMKYFPQNLIQINKKSKHHGSGYFRNYNKPKINYIQEFTNYPSNILEFDDYRNNSLHPTQKPVKLFKYLIKTYTNENDLILDNCIGSGTTAIAALETNRNFIGFEINKEYFDIANNRIKDWQNQMRF